MQKNHKEKYAPIVMFVYNRADHFQKTYHALKNCLEAKESVLYVFSDGAKNEAGAAKVQEVRNALRVVEQDGVFKEFHIVESPVNRGLANSVIAGVSQVINQYGNAIVVEDDCVVSPYFLKFMNTTLNTYKDNKKIGSIAGYTPVFDFPEFYKEDIFLTYRSCSWGWATWKDRWDRVDWDMSYMKEFYQNPVLISKMNSCGADRFIRLYRQTKGNSSSWSVRFGAQLVINDQYTIYPRYSYVSNIGCDASGVHSKAEDAESMRVDLSKAIENPNLIEVEYNPEIQQMMKKHYSSGAMSDFKRLAATIGIVLKERLKIRRHHRGRLWHD